MKKLVGIGFFWLLMIGFYYMPAPTPMATSLETIEIQQVAPIQKVTYLKKPLTAPTP